MTGEPRTGRGRASRERIVEHAAELFAERGVAGASLDDVLAAAGAGKSQLYHYFSGRDELVEAGREVRAPSVDPHERHGAIRVLLHDLVRDPHERASDVVLVQDDALLVVHILSPRLAPAKM